MYGLIRFWHQQYLRVTFLQCLLKSLFAYTKQGLWCLLLLGALAGRSTEHDSNIGSCLYSIYSALLLFLLYFYFIFVIIAHLTSCSTSWLKASNLKQPIFIHHPSHYHTDKSKILSNLEWTRLPPISFHKKCDII